MIPTYTTCKINAVTYTTYNTNTYTTTYITYNTKRILTLLKYIINNIIRLLALLTILVVFGVRLCRETVELCTMIQFVVELQRLLWLYRPIEVVQVKGFEPALFAGIESPEYLAHRLGTPLSWCLRSGWDRHIAWRAMAFAALSIGLLSSTSRERLLEMSESM